MHNKTAMATLISVLLPDLLLHFPPQLLGRNFRFIAQKLNFNFALANKRHISRAMEKFNL